MISGTVGNYDGHCMVCGAAMAAYFRKTFDNWGLRTLEYDKCVDCGFCVCASLLRMPEPQWTALNNWFHTDIYKEPGDRYNRNGRLDGQARAINAMLTHGLLDPHGRLLDWGSGVGHLAERLNRFGHTLYSFDRYIAPQINPLPEALPPSRHFALVTAGAVLEHLKHRDELNAIESLVAPNGVLGIHLLLPREIPADPDWIYLLPVHCAFHTWESMRRLMQQWGYQTTVYCHPARMWFLFKHRDGVAEAVARINAQEGDAFMCYGEGFLSDTGVTLPLDLEASVQRDLRSLYIGSRSAPAHADWLHCKLSLKQAVAMMDAGAEAALQPGSIDILYSDLIAERLSPDYFARYLDWTAALLVPGGVHRLATADLQQILDNAADGCWRAFAWVKQDGIATAADYLNACFRNWGHRFLYDAPSLITRLHAHGYRDAQRSALLQGAHAALYRLDREQHRLYVEAVR